jgi:hypothetical protein
MEFSRNLSEGLTMMKKPVVELPSDKQKGVPTKAKGAFEHFGSHILLRSTRAVGEQVRASQIQLSFLVTHFR